MGFLIGTQAGSIVAAHFKASGSIRRGTVELTDNNIRISRKTTFEIRTYRSYEYHKQIFIGRVNPHLSTCTNQ